MEWLLSFLFLCFLGLTGAGQEISVEVLNLYDTTPEVLQAMPHFGHQIAVSVSDEHLKDVSSSVLKAESWLRSHVLAYFPATKITTIVVGDTLICQKGQVHNFGLLLPSLKNIYYSLTKWGLEREIKVTAAFCFDTKFTLFRDIDLADKVTKPVLEFLLSVNSTCTVTLPQKLSPLSDETMNMVSTQMEFVKKIVSFNLASINVMVKNSEMQKPLSRKLYSSTGFSVPSNIAKNPLPPLAHTTSPPPLSIPLVAPPPLSIPLVAPPPLYFPIVSSPPMDFPSAPQQPPAFTGPALAPFGYSLPPCSPADTPAPETQVMQKLWCVAKPSVPAETLQEAIDYACGVGGADCDEIRPHGNCFYPDSVVAHASYAFNSYWQKNKRNGGTCSFGGTAMVINSDPSFLHCRFVLS